MGLIWNSDYSSLLSCLLLGFGVSGLTALFQHWHGLSNKLLSWRIARLVRMCKRQIHVVQSEEGWNRVLPLLQREVHDKGVLGLDCEWVDIGGHRHPVALLQLATYSGMCVLVRLPSFTSSLPDSLKSVLGDVTIIKAGVGIDQDRKFLEMDYSLRVEGCVDLRHMALQCHESGIVTETKVNGTLSLGLASLSLRFLGRTLDKDWRVRSSNWEAEKLTKRQLSYAAEDALVGVQLLMVMWTKLCGCDQVMKRWWLPLLPPPFFHQHVMAHIYKASHQYLDLKFSNTSPKLLHDGDGCLSQQRAPAKISQVTRAYCPRRSPLYHNCQLLAPDDMPLCTCDPKKALWYVEKGLGSIVQRDPLVVRLNFEPAGRPRSEYEDGKYYIQERQNVCVVCGQGHSYIKKNVVPHEYRKHFPNVLKDHQSHDVVLLCMRCHRVSNSHDAVLKDMLARECNAPIGREGGRKVTVDPLRRTVRNAGGALLRTRSTIPERRIIELENVVKKHFNADYISQELLQEAASIDARDWNEDYQAHGELVCKAYQQRGLVHLQQRWRRHFLDTMQPKHLPQYWSVNHNLQKMCSVMAGLPHDHPDYETYTIILVGTEGNADVQHLIQQSKETIGI